jgi:NitT/TauT family transport system substrate-binding protein
VEEISAPRIHRPDAGCIAGLNHSQQHAGDKQQIGFMGDMPAITATTKDDVGDIRIVAVNSVDPMCQYIVVASSAPKFADHKEAMLWLSGKTIGVPRGTCADRFLNVVLQKEGVHPETVLNQSNELIISGFRNRKLDAASTWEPYIGQIVDRGWGRPAQTSHRNEKLWRKNGS